MAEHGKTRRVGVVMAGGSGERFWPISRRQRPKQLLHLTQDQETMLGEAVSRVAPLIPPEDVYVVTGEHLVAAIREAGVGVPDENVIAEPCKRNTAGCLAYAAAHLLAKYGGDGDDLTMAVLTADHVIGDSEAFRATIRTAMDAAESEQALATVGMVPTRPETGYGYIQVDADADPLPQYAESVHVYPVAAFHEKPDAARAEAFVQSGRYFWNGGMFFWRLSVFLAALAEASPNIAAAIRVMTDAMRAGDDGRVRQAFEALDDISIDYALMERAHNVIVARADFDWDDVGSWPALDRTGVRDAAGNVAVGNPVVIDCRDSIIYNDAGDAMAVSVVGMKDVAVIATRDAVLVIPKDRAQDVRLAVTELKRRNAPQV